MSVIRCELMSDFLGSLLLSGGSRVREVVPCHRLCAQDEHLIFGVLSVLGQSKLLYGFVVSKSKGYFSRPKSHMRTEIDY